MQRQLLNHIDGVINLANRLDVRAVVILSKVWMGGDSFRQIKREKRIMGGEESNSSVRTQSIWQILLISAANLL